jgi:hypothetical protein
MAITRTPMIDDDGSGTTGTIINNAWKTELYNQIDAADAALGVGGWQNVPFSAANFSAMGGGTWTVDAAAITDNRYAVAGKILFWHFYISWFSGVSAVAGAVTHLLLTPPAGLLLRDYQQQIYPFAIDAGARVDADATVSTGKLAIAKRTGNWSVGSAGLIGNCWFEIS